MLLFPDIRPLVHSFRLFSLTLALLFGQINLAEAACVQRNDTVYYNEVPSATREVLIGAVNAGQSVEIEAQVRLRSVRTFDFYERFGAYGDVSLIARGEGLAVRQDLGSLKLPYVTADCAYAGDATYAAYLKAADYAWQPTSLPFVPTLSAAAGTAGAVLNLNNSASPLVPAQSAQVSVRVRWHSTPKIYGGQLLESFVYARWRIAGGAWSAWRALVRSGVGEGLTSSQPLN